MGEATEPAYQPTTVPKPKKEPCFSTSKLSVIHLGLKFSQLVLSFVAFICEEIINQCENCGGLYFFEFVSCSAFLLSILMLVIYCTPISRKINIESFKKIDFWITAVVGVLFVLASIIFAGTMDKNNLATVSVVFGFLASIAFLIELYFMYKNGYISKKEIPVNGVNGRNEAEPLNTPVQVAE